MKRAVWYGCAWLIAIYGVQSINAGSDIAENANRRQYQVGMEVDVEIPIEGDLYIFGVVADVAIGKGDRILVLDRQQSMVHVFSSDGVYERAIGREGEGPGDLQQPERISSVDSSAIGIFCRRTGRLQMYSYAGEDIGIVEPGNLRVGNRDYYHVLNMDYQNGILAFTAANVEFSESHMTQREVLFRQEPGQSGFTCVAEDSVCASIAPPLLRECDYIRPLESRWTMSANGTLFIAPSRDEYLIDIYGIGGNRVQIHEEWFKPKKRNKKKMDLIEEMLVRPYARQGMDVDVEVSAFPSCIQKLWVSEHGVLYVWNSESLEEGSENDRLARDLYSSDGRYLRTEVLHFPYQQTRDKVYQLTSSKLAVVYNHEGLRVAASGQSNSPVGENSTYVEPSVVIYRFLGSER